MAKKSKTDTKKMSFEELTQGIHKAFEEIDAYEKKEIICEKCKKTYTRSAYCSSILYKPYIDKICWDCFIKDLHNRKLTAKELRALAEDQIRDYENAYDKLYYTPHYPPYLTDSQIADVKKYEEKIEKENEQKRLKEIKAKFIKEAYKLCEEAGYDKDDLTSNFVELLAILIQRIDDKFEQAYNKVPLSEMVFR